MSKRLTALLLGVASLAVLVAACGGGGDSSGGEVLTKAEFIKQGDEICKQGEARLAEEATKYAEENEVDTENPTKAQQEGVLSEVVGPALLRQAEEIGELGAPSGDEEQAEEIVESLEKGAREIEDNPALLREGTNPIEDASQLAKEYGFKACGRE